MRLVATTLQVHFASRNISDMLLVQTLTVTGENCIRIVLLKSGNTPLLARLSNFYSICLKITF